MFYLPMLDTASNPLSTHADPEVLVTTRQEEHRLTQLRPVRVGAE